MGVCLNKKIIAFTPCIDDKKAEGSFKICRKKEFPAKEINFKIRTNQKHGGGKVSCTPSSGKIESNESFCAVKVSVSSYKLCRFRDLKIQISYWYGSEVEITTILTIESTLFKKDDSNVALQIKDSSNVSSSSPIKFDRESFEEYLDRSYIEEVNLLKAEIRKLKTANERKLYIQKTIQIMKELVDTDLIKAILSHLICIVIGIFIFTFFKAS